MINLHCCQLCCRLSTLGSLDNLLQSGRCKRLPTILVVCCILQFIVMKVFSQSLLQLTSVKGTFRFLFNVSSLFVFLISTVTWEKSLQARSGTE